MVEFYTTPQESKVKSHTLWVEKYRPTSLDTYIGNDHFKKKIQSYLDSGDVPHLLITGKPGTGKTTVAKIIVNTIDCDYLMINASDENNVDTIRNKIKMFASGVGFKSIKIVILDEADYLTSNAQSALRNIMEVFSMHTRFILTANYKERIIDPIVSRTQEYHMTPPNKSEVAKHLAWILTQEGVKYTAPDVALLVNAYHPDIRRIINQAQQQTKAGVMKVDEHKIVESDYKTKLIAILSSTGSPQQKFKEIRQTVADAKITDFTDGYALLYEKVEEYAPKAISEVILAVADGLYKDATVVDKEINFMACLINVLHIICK
jgi:DNA polymerase III delta prime subunit